MSFTFGYFVFYLFIPECKQFDIMSYHVFFIFLPGVLRDFGFVGLYFSQIWKSFGHWFSKFIPLPPPWGSSCMYSKYLMSHSWLTFCTYLSRLLQAKTSHLTSITLVQTLGKPLKTNHESLRQLVVRASLALQGDKRMDLFPWDPPSPYRFQSKMS